jgi:hypothetical protein
MKQIFTQRAGMIGMICLLTTTLLSSCLKDRNDNHYQPQQFALVSAINASPDAQPIDFFLEPNRANNFYIKSGESLDYVNAYIGKRNVTFRVGGSQQVIKTDTVTLKNGGLYSVFLANVVNTPDLLIIADSVGHPAFGKAGIRYVNLSPDAQSTDLLIKDNATPVVSAKTYKQYSPFITVGGNVSYTFQIVKHGTTTVLATVTNVTLKSNTLNTIWLQGLSAATDAKKLSAHMQENVYYVN